MIRRWNGWRLFTPDDYSVHRDSKDVAHRHSQANRKLKVTSGSSTGTEHSATGTPGKPREANAREALRPLPKPEEPARSKVPAKQRPGAPVTGALPLPSRPVDPGV